jgi:hypothetical protein
MALNLLHAQQKLHSGITYCNNNLLKYQWFVAPSVLVPNELNNLICDSICGCTQKPIIPSNTKKLDEEIKQ